MKKAFLFITFICFLNSIKAQTDITDSIMSGGVERSYRLYLSANYKAGMPLIIDLPGYGSDGALMELFSNFSPIADTGNFLVVYPEGLIDTNGNQYWNVGWSWVPKTNDVGFISDLIDSLHARNNIDLNRVYACGFSMGGFMCYSLATQLSNKVVAIASVSGSIVPTVFDTISVKRAVPVIEIHGTEDMVIPYPGINGTSPSIPIDTLIKFWKTVDGCTTEDSIAIPNSNTTDGSTVKQYIFSGGTDNAIAELYKVIGGGHIDWPGGAGDNQDFNASVAIWNFFKQYTLNEFPLGVKRVENNEPLNFYPNPSTTIFQCSLSGSWRSSLIKIQITNAIGQQVKNYIVQPSVTLQINLSDLPAGYYTVQLNNGKMSEAGKLIKE